METVTDFILWVFKITADSDCSHEIKRYLFLRRKAMAKLDSILKSRDITLPTKVFLVKLRFFSSHVWMWALDYKESWVLKNWYFWTVVLDKTLESSLDCKNIQPVHPEGNQSWIFIGRTDAEAEVQILWPPDAKNWLIGKDSDAGKDCRRRRGQQRIRWLEDITDSMDMSLSFKSRWLTGRPGVLQSMGLQRVGHDWVTELHWTEQGSGNCGRLALSNKCGGSGRSLWKLLLFYQWNRMGEKCLLWLVPSIWSPDHSSVHWPDSRGCAPGALSCMTQKSQRPSLTRGRYALNQESPISQAQPSASFQISGSIRLEIRCTINAVSLSHPETIPPTPLKNCLPWSRSVVPKRSVTSVLSDTGSITQKGRENSPGSPCLGQADQRLCRHDSHTGTGLLAGQALAAHLFGSGQISLLIDLP